jgi:general secretion pathway protein I
MGPRATKETPVASHLSQTGERGFTLLEVLVALTILSISLGVLLAIFSQGLERAQDNAQADNARTLAQSLLAQTEAAPHPSFGDTNGMTNGLQWRVRVSPYGTGPDQQAWKGLAQQIDATVTWAKGGHARSLTLSTLRLNGATGNFDSDNSQ